MKGKRPATVGRVLGADGGVTRVVDAETGGVYYATKLLLETHEAAAALSVSESTVRGLVKSGALAHVRIGRRLLFPQDALTRFVAANTRTGGATRAQAVDDIIRTVYGQPTLPLGCRSAANTHGTGIVA